MVLNVGRITRLSRIKGFQSLQITTTWLKHGNNKGNKTSTKKKNNK